MGKYEVLIGPATSNGSWHGLQHWQMRLSTKTRYGVRAILDIAYQGQDPPGVTAQAKDIARREDIPLRYLEQIFQDLKRAGLIESKRGPRGGYYLKRSAAEIKLGDVVRALQGPIEEMFVVEDMYYM